IEEARAAGTRVSARSEPLTNALCARDTGVAQARRHRALHGEPCRGAAATGTPVHGVCESLRSVGAARSETLARADAPPASTPALLFFLPRSGLSPSRGDDARRALRPGIKYGAGCAASERDRAS